MLLNNNFTLKNNNIYSILGKNGSGKTTLLYVITNLLNKNDFEIDCSVNLDSIDLYKLNSQFLYKFRSDNFKFVFQDPVSAFDPLKKLKYYFNLTKVSDEIINKELQYFQLPQLAEIKKLYPHELSIGMLQRVNIILALVSRPKILLLDEPTSALDLPIMNLLNNRLKEYVITNERIVLIVTQDIEFAKNTSDYIANLDNGKLSNFEVAKDYFKINSVF
ncbi:MAG: ATP-binding cassette domain-containing protein [Bacteroidetes bacterium]|nr:ATP-binding cassette domain-containing protein [Bacteroidota bacterium]MBU1117131.1 ATP-binding cassette domain-containing protein [Bacteroidota bacterium]MBU1800326.1 ATP-binding cassette domain-containing protein [Bacteroidota bacterium]